MSNENETYTKRCGILCRTKMPGMIFFSKVKLFELFVKNYRRRRRGGAAESGGGRGGCDVTACFVRAIRQAAALRSGLRDQGN